MTTLPKNSHNNSFIITLAHAICPHLFREFMSLVHSTNPARLLVERNIKIIIILKQPEELIVIILLPQINTPHRVTFKVKHFSSTAPSCQGGENQIRK